MLGRVCAWSEGWSEPIRAVQKKSRPQEGFADVLVWREKECGGRRIGRLTPIEMEREPNQWEGPAAAAKGVLVLRHLTHTHRRAKRRSFRFPTQARTQSTQPALPTCRAPFIRLVFHLHHPSHRLHRITLFFQHFNLLHHFHTVKHTSLRLGFPSSQRNKETKKTKAKLASFQVACPSCPSHQQPPQHQPPPARLHRPPTEHLRLPRPQHRSSPLSRAQS